MYCARITRDAPTAFIFLIDRSGSMGERMNFGDTVTTKAEVVSMVTNMLIRELINRCRKEQGVMDYFDIAVIGYADDRAGMLVGTKNSFAKPSVLSAADCRKRVFTKERVLPNGSTTLISDELKYWVEPGAQGNTPMRAALEQAYLLADKWCKRPANRTSYPPTIINITDGEATDGDDESLIELARQIKSLHTDDGNALLININITSASSDRHVIFPGGSEELPQCRHAHTLYEMSSVMPEPYNESIMHIRQGIRPPFRGMSLNTSAADLIAMMNIGSHSINKIV